MAGVTVDSGEFPLMRSVDVTHQPARANVYNEWTKAFNYSVPDAVEHLADIIQDVYSYELWKDKYLDTPEEFFERIGILGLNLEDPAKLIKALRDGDEETIQQVISAQRVDGLAAQGMSQAAIADEVGLSQSRVSRICSRVHKPRKTDSRQLYLPKDTTRAAAKIRDKFGPEFAQQLKEAL